MNHVHAGKITSILSLLLIVCAVAGAPAAEAQMLRVESYTFTSRRFKEVARVEVDAQRIVIPVQRGGSVRIASQHPLQRVRLRLLWTGSKQIACWLYAGPMPLWEGRLREGEAVDLDLSIRNGSGLTLSCSGGGRKAGALLLEQAAVVDNQGDTHDLQSAFQPGFAERQDAVLSRRTDPEPLTQRRPAAEAAELVRQDWYAQVGLRPLRETAEAELERSRRILARQERTEGKWAQDMQALADRLDKASDQDLEEVYEAIRSLKRQALLSDPGIDFEAIYCIDNAYAVGGPPAHHEVLSRNSSTAAQGGRLLVLEGLGPDAPVRKLAPAGGPASFWRPDLSYDAQRVLFCMKAADRQSYDLYEIGIDGSGLRQITDSEYEDLDPAYAPDGSIVFTSSRINQFLRCGNEQFRNFILTRCDPDGSDIYFISANVEVDHAPTVLPDGRLLYGRWEYVDREVFSIQGLWTVNLDGTNINTFWGNQSKWPDLLTFGHVIPGSQRVLCNAIGHHRVYDGAICIIDREQGLNYPDGVFNLTPQVGWPEAGPGPADQAWNADHQAPDCYQSFLTPVPLSPDLLLVSARPGIKPDIFDDPAPGWHHLYLMDYDGNMELLYQGAYNILYAQPVRPRPRPVVAASTVQWPGPQQTLDQTVQPGVIYSADVYEGSDIPRGMVRNLRVLEIESNTFSAPGRGSMQALKAYQSQGYRLPIKLTGTVPMSLLYDEGPKRILGTASIREDGSFAVEVPPVRALYLQLLDERGRCVQTMRSSFHVMPGEVRGCLGCHETRSNAPGTVVRPQAFTAKPTALTPPAWGDQTVSFPRFVQPILDAHCVRCHNDVKTGGGYDFRHRTQGDVPISWPYVLLVFGKPPFGKDDDLQERSIAGPLFPYRVYENERVEIPTLDTVAPPMTAMSYRSRLLDLATSGKHHDVQISPEEEARLVAWIDTMTPYWGQEEILHIPDPKGGRRETYSARMRTAPRVFRAFAQDAYRSQEDRVPTDAQGKELPSVFLESGQRRYRLPETDE